MRKQLFAAIAGLTVLSTSVAEQSAVRNESQCQLVPTQKERIARLMGQDPKAMDRDGYPSDPLVMYQRANEIGDMRAAWGAIIMVQEGVNTKRDLWRADELWRGHWCLQVLPAFEDKPHVAFEVLKAAAGRGLPSAMIRLSEVYSAGGFGQPADQQRAEEWRKKYDAAQRATK